jgi:hypothetical protein
MRSERKAMRARALKFLTTEEGKYLDEYLRCYRFLEDDVPGIPPWVTYAELRRMAARLRSGKMRGDPRIPPNDLADLIERSIRQDQLVRGILKAERDQMAFERECDQKDEANRRRGLRAGFHRLKSSPQAADPDSPVAKKVRSLNRKLRNELGCPRKRRKG